MKHLNDETGVLKNCPSHYCPGCDHSILHKIVAEVLEEMGAANKAIGVTPVGCAVYAYEYLNIDFCQTARGHASATAAGIKTVRPESIVFTYQDDGDSAGIDTGEFIHAANRGENITVIFNNNGVCGAMENGGVKHTPIKLSEIVAGLERPVYVARVAVNTPENCEKAKRAISCAFKLQQQGKGFTFVEVVGTCPTHMCMKPEDAHKWLSEHTLPLFPLRTFKDTQNIEG